MKKTLIALLLISVFSNAFANELDCTSSKKVEGWNGGSTFDFVKVRAALERNELKNPQIEGAFSADYDGLLDGKISRNQKWIRYSAIEDAWCWFTIVLPADFNQRIHFVGFVDKVCEEGRGRESFRVSCSLKP